MTDPTNVHEPVPQSAKLTAREKKWIIYDVGNSAFVLLSTAVIPIYAKSLMPADGNIVSAWGYAQTIASLVIALLMPLLGSIADVQGMKIKFFLGFFGTGVVTCCAMALPLTWLPFLVVYILATIGLNGSLTFYDSMLIDATSNERMDKVSSHGYGWGYIGYLSIPSIGLELPVMSEWSYAGLKVAPGRYSGSTYADNMVVCAHNYAKHFSPIKWLALGSEVYFTDMDGQRWSYEVSNVETIQPTDIDKMITASDEDAWDLTLFTCTTGGRARCAVRCTRTGYPVLETSAAGRITE